MKQYLPHIALFILGAVLAVTVYSWFIPKPEPDYKPILERLDQIEASHADTLRFILKERSQIKKDCTVIINNYENILSKPVPNELRDSLARTIIRYFEPR